MRSDLAVLLALAGCQYTDIERPIALHFDGISDEDRATFAEAAACWNLRFGTQLSTEADGDQLVDVFYDDATCLVSVAQVQPGTPTRLGVCPQHYWNAVLDRMGAGVYQHDVDPFRVFSHELGHVLNIIGHPDDGFAVMRSGGTEGGSMFAKIDVEMFGEYNADHAIATPCRQVVRTHAPGTAIGRCACDDGTRLDPALPIAITFAKDVTDDEGEAIAAALTCWNARYGLQLAVRAPVPGDQRMVMDHRYFTPVHDRGIVYAAAGGPFAPMAQVGRALGIDYQLKLTGGPLFTAADDDAFELRYGRGVVCRDLVPELKGSCRCLPGPADLPAE